MGVAFEQTFKSLLGPGQEIKLLQRLIPKAKDLHSTHKQISCQFCLEPRAEKSEEQRKWNEPGKWEKPLAIWVEITCLMTNATHHRVILTGKKNRTIADVSRFLMSFIKGLILRSIRSANIRYHPPRCQNSCVAPNCFDLGYENRSSLLTR